MCYYPIYKPETLLSKKTTEDYLSGSTVNTTETFFYNQNNLLNYKSTEPSSIFRSLEDRFYYPTDIVNNAQYDLATKQNMQKLIDLNRLSEKVKIESSIRTKGQLTTKTTYVEYENGNRYLPLNFFSALGSNSLLCDLSVKYNSQSNIIEKKDKNLQVTSYVWSYNGQYPIAEIKNATYQQVSNAVPGFLSAIESWANPSDLMLNSFFGSLRSGLTGAQITTYTYKPLVGMTSATDPRGVTTYYDYDEFNRLKEVYQKDSNGSKLTITQHDYNYKH